MYNIVRSSRLGEQIVQDVNESALDKTEEKHAA